MSAQQPAQILPLVNLLSPFFYSCNNLLSPKVMSERYQISMKNCKLINEETGHGNLHRTLNILKSQCKSSFVECETKAQEMKFYYWITFVLKYTENC